jgi:hypothetical protein
LTRSQLVPEHFYGLGARNAVIVLNDERGRGVHAQAGRFFSRGLDSGPALPGLQSLLYCTTAARTAEKKAQLRSGKPGNIYPL